MLKPFHDNILVEILKPCQRKSGQIILNESKSQFHAKVLAVGPGTEEKTVQAKVGDIVIVKAGGHPVEEMGTEFKLINHSLILGKIEEESQ